MSKVITSRIKSVLLNIIHHNQTGFTKDRFIGEAIRSIYMYHIMDYTAEDSLILKVKLLIVYMQSGILFLNVLKLSILAQTSYTGLNLYI